MNEPNRDPQSSLDPSGSQVQDRAVRPPGVLPKNTQTYIIIGIAVLMVGAIAFSGAGTPSRNAATAAPKTPTAVDPNWARIQDYRNRIDEQARKLADEQAKLEQAKQAFGVAPGAGSPATQMTPPPGYAYPAYQQPEPRSEPKPEKSAIEVDKEKREYQSLFASNVALSYRKSEDQPAIASVAPPPAVPVGSISHPPPTQAAVRTTKAPASTETDSDEVEPVVPDESPRSASANRKKALPSLNEAGGKQYRLFEGSIIETTLTNRLNGSFTGPVNCLVTTDVYSHDRQHVLIPKGSRVLGEAKRNDSFGQQRIAVFFHRLIMPDGFSVDLDQFHGLNQIGETGLRDQVNHHYGQVFGISLAVGAIAGLATINTGSGLNASGLDAYRQGVATNLSQSSLRILDKYLNVLPTFTIREGHRIKVILSDDLELPAYERHKMASDL
jgi:type IV secretory pathway VirB10-like protein